MAKIKFGNAYFEEWQCSTTGRLPYYWRYYDVDVDFVAIKPENDGTYSIWSAIPNLGFPKYPDSEKHQFENIEQGKQFIDDHIRRMHKLRMFQ